jgi:hypothetical protein
VTSRTVRAEAGAAPKKRGNPLASDVAAAVRAFVRSVAKNEKLGLKGLVPGHNEKWLRNKLERGRVLSNADAHEILEGLRRYVAPNGGRLKFPRRILLEQALGLRQIDHSERTAEARITTALDTIAAAYKGKRTAREIWNHAQIPRMLEYSSLEGYAFALEREVDWLHQNPPRR